MSTILLLVARTVNLVVAYIFFLRNSGMYWRSTLRLLFCHSMTAGGVVRTLKLYLL